MAEPTCAPLTSIYSLAGATGLLATDPFSPAHERCEMTLKKDAIGRDPAAAAGLLEMDAGLTFGFLPVGALCVVAGRGSCGPELNRPQKVGPPGLVGT
jgi:hypothetical protein